MNNDDLDIKEEKDEKETKSKNESRRTDLLLKVISFLTAVFIWFFVIGVESPIGERKLTSVPVSIPSLKGFQLAVMSTKELYCDIIVSGKKSDINKLKTSDFQAYLDVEEISSAGLHSLPVYVNDIDNITIDSIEPQNLSVYIDKSNSRDIPVIAEIKQKYNDAEVKIGDPIPTVEFITVTGAEAILKTIKYAKVDLYFGLDKKIEKPISATEKFILIDENGEEVKSSFIKTNVTEVTVHIPVSIEKDIPLTVKYKYGYYNEKNTSVEITPKTIKIEGSPDFLNTIDEISLGTIDEKTIEDDASLTFSIPIPEGTINKSGTNTATVEIKFIDTDTRTMMLNKNDIRITPPTNSNYKYSIMNEEVRIKLRGSVSSLHYLSKSKISAGIDLSQITEVGIYSIPINIVILDDLSVFSVGQYTVNVEIS